MDQASLVAADIESGRKFFEALRTSKPAKVEAAFWWLDDGEWRFVVASPIVDSKGRLAALRKIESALGSSRQQFESILDRLDILSPSEGLITVLDVGSLGKVPFNRLVKGESVRGVYVGGAYFYFFAPRTFIAA